LPFRISRKNMAKTQLSALAVLLLGSLLPLSESARVVESQLKAELDKTDVDVKSLKTESDMEGKTAMWPFSNSGANRPKICCCEKYAGAKSGEAKCYWQNKISFDTGSGCNLGGLVNPWADKQHISGITDQTRAVKGDGEDPAKNLLVFSPNDASKQDMYGQLCEALSGDIVNGAHGLIRLNDLHGHVHQYIVDKKHFAPSAVVVHEPSPPVDTPAPEAEQVADKQAMEAVVAAFELKVTNKLLKDHMRAFKSGAHGPANTYLCSLACDKFPLPPMGNNGRRATAKKGCHTPLSKQSFHSNAVNYCKNVCTPEKGCK